MFDPDSPNTTDLSPPTTEVMDDMFFALREREAEEHRRSIALHRRVLAEFYGEAA